MRVLKCLNIDRKKLKRQLKRQSPLFKVLRAVKKRDLLPSWTSWERKMRYWKNTTK